MYKIFLFPLFLSLLILSGCPSNTIWTGDTYSGTITKESNKGIFTYWDTYNLYCSGTWEFTITSKDNVSIFLEGLDPLTWKPKMDDLYAKASSNSTIVYLSGTTEIDICVLSNDTDWQNNGFNAGYSFTATLK